MAETLIEYLEFNLLMSMLDNFIQKFNGKTVSNKSMYVAQSNSDPHLAYKVPAFSVEVMYRRGKSVGFNNYLGDLQMENNIAEIEGSIFEYRVQLNVYSNTRGDNYKWCSILDDILKEGENGIPINIYNDNGSIQAPNISTIQYVYAEDIRSNSMPPNIVTYDFHTIYEWKFKVVQEYSTIFDILDGDKIDVKKNNEVN